MSEISKEALAAACEEKVKQLEFSVKQSAFDSVRQELETELAIARIALLALRERAEPVGFVGRHKETGKFASWLYPEAPWLTDDKYEVLSAYIAQPAPVVPDEIIDLLHAARSYVKSCAGSDGHAFGVLMAIDRVCHSSMLQPVSQPYKLP
ncbi:hypothetical protein [Cronobacter sakazakii]|uniref:hypothetical protein n=1 Tax=Cronobacter sakazakii TaxID=28141 RepID=UPI001375EE34|nr:hypothetical protein [Cronobacter sakazakii]EJJ0546375.1 hypothetical protein [Cronobacter sakazakii]NCH18328.1 hypothetical protein [Cronobacter sakazakii]